VVIFKKENINLNYIYIIMLYIIFTLAIVTGLFLSYLFLSTSKDAGIPLKAVGRAETALDSMSVIAPESQEHIMREIESTVSLSSVIVSSVKSDEIACIVPQSEFHNEKTTLILPGQAAYADTPIGKGEMFGDAVVTDVSTLQLENPLLNKLKANEERYDKLVSELLLFMDTSDDKFRKRMKRRAEETKKILISLRSELITACSEQRIRLRRTHPQLSHYHFKHESVHDKSEMPQYLFGVSSEPVSKTKGVVSNPDALLSEYYSYD
jgi:hypothetical protein